jgi:hypothetical protein
MINLTDALLALRPEGGYRIELDESIEYFGDSENKPTLEAIKVKQVEMQTVYDSKAYSRQRQAAYAALNQFEMQFDDAANSTTTWVDAINAIKQEFPK